MLEWGPYVKLLERRRKRGKPVAALDNKPELFEDLELAWEAFHELHRQRRSGGFSPEPLNVSDISIWLEMNNYRGIQKREMYELIVILDSCWMTHIQKELERREKAKKNKKHGKT